MKIYDKSQDEVIDLDGLFDFIYEQLSDREIKRVLNYMKERIQKIEEKMEDDDDYYD